MRSRDLLATLMLLGLVGCGTSGQATDRHSDADQILQVLQAARSALLNDRAHAVCALLTAHGRARTLGFQVDFAPEGTPVPSRDRRLPQTCEQVVARLWSEVRRSHGAITWPADLRRVSFSVASISGTQATARMRVDKPYGPVVTITMRRTPAGWRIDDSDAVPAGY